MAMELEAIIIAIVGSLTSLSGVIAAVAAFVSKFKKIGHKIEDMTETKELKAALAEAHQENIRLAKTVRKLTDKLNKVLTPEEIDEEELFK